MIFVLDFLFVCLFCFQDRVSLYSAGCPGTHSVDQAGIEIRNPPASASQYSGITGVHHHRLANSDLSNADRIHHFSCSVNYNRFDCEAGHREEFPNS